MTKKDVTLTIEKDVLEKAKKEMPSISKFVEECLKAYLGLSTDSLFKTHDAQEILTQIKNAQAQLYIMIEQNNIEENYQQAQKDAIQYAWRKAYDDYKRYGHVEPENMKNACDKLGETEEIITGLIQMCRAFSYHDGVDFSCYECVKDAYLEDVLDEIGELR